MNHVGWATCCPRVQHTPPCQPTHTSLQFSHVPLPPREYIRRHLVLHRRNLSTTTLLVRRGRSRSPARGDHQSPRTISVQHRRMGIAAGSFACHLDITTRRRGFLDALATNQTHRDTALRCTLASGRMDDPIKDKAPRIHSVATPLLGTPDPRRCRFRASHGLPALQPG